MADTDKVESKPDTEDPKTDEEHPLDAARREGLRLSPLSQTQHLDTTEGGIVDLHRISPVFEEARQHAVRQGALAADEEYGSDTVVFPDDKDEADRAREHVRKLAEELPEEDEETDRRPPGGYADGQGQAYNPEMVEKDAAARAGQETEATGTNPATGKDAESSDKAEDADKGGTAAKSSGTTTAKAPAKSTTSSTRSTSTSSKTASK
jgi:hypothetical protein